MDSIKKKFQNPLPVKEGRYVIVDTETTGLGNLDHILEIAAVEIFNGRITGRQFHAYLHPRKKISPNAIKLHGLADNFYERYYNNTYKSDKQIMENFVDFIGDSYIFCHNSKFDCSFIERELNFWGLKNIPKDRYKCTMQIFKDVYGSKSNLKSCCEHLNLEFSANNFHSAIYDAFMTARLICSMMNSNETNYDEEVSIEISENDDDIIISPTSTDDPNNGNTSKLLTNKRKRSVDKEQIHSKSSSLLKSTNADKENNTDGNLTRQCNHEQLNDHQEDTLVNLDADDLNKLFNSHEFIENPEKHYVTLGEDMKVAAEELEIILRDTET